MSLPIIYTVYTCIYLNSIHGLLFYLSADTVNFKPWKSVDTIQRHGRNISCHVHNKLQPLLINSTIVKLLITTDAQAVTSGSRGTWTLFEGR